ncbi:type VI immunity family protein [Sagittula sp. S175]|uniref:type VI immunity family protein n=1 Tax=Sagittula sp. S175 TaxID=3415129 RepID=UPI003C79D4F7
MANDPSALTAETIDDIRIPTRGGQVMRVGPAVSLYHARPRTAETTAAVAHALQLFLDLAGPHIRFAGIDGQHLLPISQTDPAALPAFVTQQDPARGFGLHLHGGADRDDAHPLYFRCLLPAAWNPQPMTYVSMGLTMARQMTEGLPPLTHWTADAAARFGAWHGSAGFALTAHGAWSHGKAVMADVASVLDRFPGLDYPAQGAALHVVREGPVAANWITLLADDLADRIGGAAKVAEVITGFGGQVRPWAGGLSLIAAGAPQIGDTEQGMTAESYTIPGRLIASLRGAPDAAYFPGAAGRDMIAFGKDWRARFD